MISEEKIENKDNLEILIKTLFLYDYNVNDDNIE